VESGTNGNGALPAQRLGAAGPRLLLYSPDSLALGHLQRNVKIASRFVAQTPGATALMLTSSPHGLDRHLPDGIDFVKLPTVAGTFGSNFEFVSLRVSDATVSAIRAAVIRAAVEAFEPDLLLIDYLPLGVRGELRATIEYCSDLPAPPAIVLGLRDIIGPEDRRERALDPSAAVERHYDRVLIYGPAGICPTAQNAGLTGAALEKVTYCGYLQPDAGTRDRAGARAALELGDAKLIVITGGGGRDAYPMIDRCVAALAQLPPAGHRTIALAGPMMDDLDRAALTQLVHGTKIELWAQALDPPALFSAADVILTMGGYNSIVEAVSAGARVLVLPRRVHSPVRTMSTAPRDAYATPSALPPDTEQLLRAEAFAARGLAEVIAQDADAGAVATAIERALAAPRRTQTETLGFDGLARVTHELCTLIDARRAAATVAPAQ
jgi:predicted glycosyltransferase